MICASVTGRCPAPRLHASRPTTSVRQRRGVRPRGRMLGYLYGLNLADSLIEQGRHRTIAVIGCDAMSTILDYEERGVSILFGDVGGAVILQRDEDPSRGCQYQSMGADATSWQSLYIPTREVDIPENDRDNPIKLGKLRMNGREVFKFAVKKFLEVIEDAIEQSGVSIDDISQLVCHHQPANHRERA